MQIVKTVCSCCNNRCGINVHVEDGRIVKVMGMPEHPLKTLCEKAAAIPTLVHSPERLTDPLRRVNGSWHKISWDEAFGFMVDKLTSIKQKYGAQALVVHDGTPLIGTVAQKIIRRFTDLYGSPNYTTVGTFCFLPRVIGHSLTCGEFISPYYTAQTRCMVVWGKNPTASYPVQEDAMNALLGRGARLIVIDPRATPMAKKADIHAQIRPGTDCALALGVLNVIIAEELYDKAFVKEWTVGFNKLVEHVRKFPPDEVAKITWVPAETVRDIARMYGTSRPAYISLGISMDHCTNGIQAIRAISSLIAVTGNLDVPGGNIYVPRLRQTNLRVKENVNESIGIGAGYPLYTKYSLEQTITPVISQILSEKPYPIKALLIIGANPLLTWPNTNKVKEAFKRLELVVVADIFMTDTASMADLVLPSTTFLERQETRDYVPHSADALFVVTSKVVEPVGNSMDDWRMWAELGKRMGYAEYFPWQDTDELLEYLLKSTDMSLEELKRKPGGIRYAEQEFQKYLRDGFNTPSGKVELYSEILAKLGYDPLPTFHEPLESPVSCKELAEDYPLILITGTRSRAYFHTQYRNVPGLRNLVPEPLIEIHPLTARKLEIANDDLVEVKSLRGIIRLKARLTEDIHPKVVSIQHGWSEANVNFLTDSEARDPISSCTGFRSVMCRVMKVEE